VTALGLLRGRRFGAYFWTQFLGAFNDNVFRNALVILIAFRSWSIAGLAPGAVVAVAGGVFIVPFFLFSPLAGEVADALPKSTVIRWTKAAEVLIMLGAAAAFAWGGLAILLVVLFFMGAQSAAFGPVKYGILPELVADDDLVGANALVETGTFLAILLGTITGGLLIGLGAAGPAWVSVVVVGVAAAGFAASLAVPALAPADAHLRIARNPLAPLGETIRSARAVHSVFLSILGLSWFWFFGSALLALLPTYTRDVLGAGEGVVTTFLALFCVGVAAGSMLCERLSEHKVELGLVPLGSLGMSVFAFDLFLARSPGLPSGATRDLAAFLATTGSRRIMADLALLALFGGLYTVPLYAFIQHRSDVAMRARVIAGNNVMGALFMVASAIVIAVFQEAGLSIPETFLALAVMNAAVACYVYTVVPEFLFRFLAWILAHVLYRLKTEGREHIPDTGAVLLVCNHVSFVDWLVIASACKRPARFVMHRAFLDLPLLGFFFRDAKVIPIASARESEDVVAAAFDRIAAELEAGEVVCIFPEGRLTTDGELGPFRPGVERIVARTPVPVVPMALVGLWGSFFSRKDDAAFRRPFRRVWSRIRLVIGAPVPPTEVRADDLARRVAALGGFTPPAPPA
jgi:1-acyl-sn-glycerol-3-phosphate acyltransferase